MLSDVEVYTLTQRVHNCIVYYSLQEFQIQKMEDTDCERLVVRTIIDTCVTTATL